MGNYKIKVITAVSIMAVIFIAFLLLSDIVFHKTRIMTDSIFGTHFQIEGDYKLDENEYYNDNLNAITYSSSDENGVQYISMEVSQYPYTEKLLKNKDDIRARDFEMEFINDRIAVNKVSFKDSSGEYRILFMAVGSDKKGMEGALKLAARTVDLSKFCWEGGKCAGK